MTKGYKVGQEVIHPIPPPLWKHKAICWRGHGRKGWALRSDTEKGLAAMVAYHLVSQHPGALADIPLPFRFDLPSTTLTELLPLLGQRPPAGLGRFLRYWR